MKLIQRYLIKSVIQAICMVIFIVACVEVFILFVSELHDIGQGNYQVLNAFEFSVMQLPFLIYQFYPLASLLGGLLGLGLLASHSEITVMRASGFSIQKIAFSVIIAGLLMLVLVMVIGETIAPDLQRYANLRKALATSGGQALPMSGGLWLHHKNYFVHIDQINQDDQLLGIRSYQLNETQQLKQSLYAQRAYYHDKRWWLQDVAITDLTDQNLHVSHYADYPWDMQLSPAVLHMSAIEPHQASIKFLYHYIRAHQQNYGEVNKYQLVFWSRILQPLTTCVMMLLAVPFVFGSARNVTISTRIVWGVLLGFGFYILNQFFGPISLVLRIPPFIAAALPTLIFSVGAFVLLRR